MRLADRAWWEQMMLTNRLNIANTGVLLIDSVKAFPYSQDFTCMNSNVGCLTSCTSGRLMNHDTRIGQCISLSWLAYKRTFLLGKSLICRQAVTCLAYQLQAATIPWSMLAHYIKSKRVIGYTLNQTYMCAQSSRPLIICFLFSYLHLLTREKKMLSVNQIANSKAVFENRWG